MKEDQNKTTLSEENNHEQNQEHQSKAAPSAWKKMMRKKWFFPAVYLAAAALILALITWYQNPNDFAIDKDELGLDTIEEYDAEMENGDETSLDDGVVPVQGHQEDMIRPVADDENVQVVLNYYDDSSSEEANMAAMVEHNNTFYPSRGISFSKEAGEESFDVLAALSGKVVRADKAPLVGNFVEIQHEDGLMTVYQSMENLYVKEGDEVEQGHVLGQAGRNELHKDLGIHLHFEVHEDGEPVNPNKHLSQAE